MSAIVAFSASLTLHDAEDEKAVRMSAMGQKPT